MTVAERSESVIDLLVSLVKFQGQIRSVPKTSENPYFNSRYASLDAVWEMCRKPLSDNGLALVQAIVQEEGKSYLVTTLYHTSGQWMASRYPIMPMKQKKDTGWEASKDPQSIGSAITYARRYAMSALLGVAAEEDTDGQAAPRNAARGTQRGAPPARTASQSVQAPAATHSPAKAAATAGEYETRLQAFYDKAHEELGMDVVAVNTIAKKEGVDFSNPATDLRALWAKLPAKVKP